MIRTVFLVLSAVVALLAVACSYTPRSSKVNDYILSLRHDYLSTHPDGEFNEYVRRGEVVKGMDYLAVLAAWGHPDRRLVPSESTLEYWTYIEEDENSKDTVAYKFTFRKSKLYTWNVNRQIASTGNMINLDEGAAGTLTRKDINKVGKSKTRKRF